MKLNKLFNKTFFSCFLPGLIIGAAIFVLIFGTATLDVTSDDFIKPGFIEADLTQHYTGFMLYRSSDWQFPLGVGQNLTYPYGSPVSFSDSIPLFAITAKLFSTVLPETFQYFGWFTLLSYSFQGGFAALLIALFIDKKQKTAFYITVFSGSALFCLAPILLERTFRHTALSAMFIITLSLYLYFVSKRQQKFNVWFFAVAFFAITIHPYFVPLTYAVMFAFVLENAVLNKRYINSILSLLICFLLTIVSAVSIGYLYGGTPVSEGGYGWFSMNLNAFFNPFSKGIEDWSLIIPPLAQTNGNLDGFNYLGIAVILANVIFLISFIFEKQKISKLKNFIKKYFGLILVNFILLVFAVSNVPTFYSKTLFGIAIPFKTINDFFSIFRASGRMAWVCYYLLFLVAVVACFRLSQKIRLKNISPQLVGSLSVVALVVVQLVDISSPILQKSSYFNQFETGEITTKGFIDGKPVETQHIDFDFWLSATKQLDVVVAIDDNDPTKRVELAFCAAKNETPVNVYFFGVIANVEQRNEFIDGIKQKLKTGNVEENTLTLSTDFDMFLDEFENEHNNFDIYLKDGFMFPLSPNDDILNIKDSGIANITEQSFFASDVDGGGYVGGINVELSVVAVKNTDRNKQLLLFEDIKIIKSENNIANVVSVTEDGEYINIVVEKNDSLNEFAFPSVLVAE